MKRNYLLFSLLLVGAFCVTSTAKVHAFVTTTGGDGYSPVIFQNKIFNIFHHQHISVDPLNPTLDIDCFDKTTGALCPNYPRYFSSTSGSSGRLGVGTAGTADISTTYYPHFSSILGDKVFYAAQRDSDNGIGCFDLNSNTNCGYFPLGSLAWSGNGAVPAAVDGIVQEDNKLYSVGADMQMYCLDVSSLLSPVACSGQPYSFNTGITAQLPAYNGVAFEVPNDVNTPDLTKVFIDVNYSTATPANDARLTCFDTNINARCAGWTSTDIPASASTYSRSIIHAYDPSGNFTSVCTSTLIVNPPQCFNPATMASTPPPPHFLSSITSRDPPTMTWVWDHVYSDHNTIYLAISGGGPGNFGEAYCYDFTAQNYCPNFGTAGVKAWDGLDGGIAVNGGVTKDYGYAIDRKCMYGLGDAGVLWTFTADTGTVAPGAFVCNANSIIITPASPPSTIPKLPNTGVAPLRPAHYLSIIPAIVGMIYGLCMVYIFRKKKSSF